MEKVKNNEIILRLIVKDIMVEAFIKRKIGQFHIASGKIFSFYKIANTIQKLKKIILLNLKKE